MARIFYSMAGEGRGHATRVRAVVEQLRHEHELVLFAPDEVFDFLAPRYPPGTPRIEVRRIPGPRFHYTRGRLDLTRSISYGVRYARQLPELVAALQRTIRDERPDVAIADFEPALPRAATACGVPLISLDHQHFLVACDLSSLPVFLRGYATLMSLVIKCYHRGAEATIVSSFFRCPLRRHYGHVVQVGPLLRPEIHSAARSSGHYLLSYLRAKSPPQVVEMLKTSGREVRVYGLGRRPAEGSVTFHELSEHDFTRDLAGCAALVGAAGNQTLGEAFYLGKPVLALPEERHHEQLINAHFLQQMGAGAWTTIEAVRLPHLAQFLERLSDFRARIQRHAGCLDGTAAAIAQIRRFLPQPKWPATYYPPQHFGEHGASPTSEPVLERIN